MTVAMQMAPVRITRAIVNQINQLGRIGNGSAILPSIGLRIWLTSFVKARERRYDLLWLRNRVLQDVPSLSIESHFFLRIYLDRNHPMKIRTTENMIMRFILARSSFNSWI